MRSWVASITSGEVMERLNTLTGRMVLTKVCARGSCVPATSFSRERRKSEGMILRSSNTYLDGILTSSGRPSSASNSTAASWTASQSSSLRKLARVRTVGRIMVELMTSPRNKRRKISAASMKICPRKAGHAASSMAFRGTTPYGRAMNSKRPAEKPTWRHRCSFSSRPCKAQQVGHAFGLCDGAARSED